MILDAAEQVIREEGYAAASTRRVAIHADLKPSLVHYYFPTTDDLFLAVFKRGAAQSDAMIEEALSSDDPLRALWRFFADTSRNNLALEFVALANHRKVIGAEIVRHSEAMRARQVALLEQLIGERLAATGGGTAAGFSLVLAGVGRALVMEGEMGIRAGHDDARAFVEAWLDRLLA
ncbi:TetR/AcrR family transcriptional regulator [Caulobacter soli]|uniref:TetR/AcrR family transcriptional regulator n=1 Tax=Caulobacter soli TaxID=2708539 RepID=UPI00196B44DD|nr:TetR/AcrR family transcriptional regulator [Caulobacter soli]